jgi:hypothetical protein
VATAPIDNFVTEFLPDVARRVHVRVVLIQRMIIQVAKTAGAGAPWNNAPDRTSFWMLQLHCYSYRGSEKRLTLGYIPLK